MENWRVETKLQNRNIKPSGYHDGNFGFCPSTCLPPAYWRLNEEAIFDCLVFLTAQRWIIIMNQNLNFGEATHLRDIREASAVSFVEGFYKNSLYACRRHIA